MVKPRVQVRLRSRKRDWDGSKQRHSPTPPMIHPDDSRPPVSRATSADRVLRPTRVRWHVMALLLVVSALTFLDRLNLSIAGKFIQDEFHIGTQTMGWILSAFVLGYALFQVPGGWLAVRYWPRVVITAATLRWSLF